jgi:hypothetical protein
MVGLYKCFCVFESKNVKIKRKVLTSDACRHRPAGQRLACNMCRNGIAKA